MNNKCNAYINLRMAPRFFSQSSGHLPPVVAWMEKMMRILHGGFSTHGSPLPIAFPEYLSGDTRRLGRMVRVFAKDEKELGKFLDTIRTHEWVRDNVTISPIKKVPIKVSYWAFFHRVRWPHRRRSAQVYRDLCLQAERLPSVRIVSKSNGNPFILAIGKGSFSRSSEKGEGGSLDGYGLSRKSTPVPVPVFDE